MKREAQMKRQTQPAQMKRHKQNTLLTAEHKELFYRGSTTYYNATRFFPPNIREQVTCLYAFVRKVDNFVDCIPQQAKAFENFYADYRLSLARLGLADLDADLGDDLDADLSANSDNTGDPIILSFVKLMAEVDIDSEWIEAFFSSMRLDIHKSLYATIDEVIHYMYGSAEVIGLCMARIMKIPESAFTGARMLGRAMQYINFIRDLREDTQFGRRYLPLGEASFSSLEFSETQQYPHEFEEFMRSELKRFVAWQLEAEDAFPFLPFRYRIAVKTASDMYIWTAWQIYCNPWIVYSGSKKPQKLRILLCAALNFVHMLLPLSPSRRERKFFAKFLG